MDIFDSLIRRSGAIPHLVELLWSEYLTHLQERIADRIKAGKATVDCATALKKATALDFMTFSRRYLNENRPVENFPLDNNHGVRLTNNKFVSVSPPTDVSGTMQDAHAVSITEGRNRPGEAEMQMGPGAIGIR